MRPGTLASSRPRRPGGCAAEAGVKGPGAASTRIYRCAPRSATLSVAPAADAAKLAADPGRMTPEWLLVDGSSAIFRAFYGVPQTFRAPNGFLVNAVRGTLDRLASVITERKPLHVALTTDEDWRPDWRVELIPGYKAHRVAEPVPPLLIPQMPVIMEALEAVGLDALGLEDYEAEDLIASLVDKAEK